MPEALIALLFIALQDVERPMALVAFEKARQSLVGRMSWSVAVADDKGRELHYISRFAHNGDSIFENRGDADGWTQFQPMSNEPMSRFPQLYMRNGDGFWHYRETDVIANLWKNTDESPSSEEKRYIATRVRDVRAIGTLPWSKNIEGFDGFTAVWDPYPTANESPTWSVEHHDDIWRVVAAYPRNRRIIWSINAGKGWNAERITQEIDGRATAEVSCTLREFEGTWFPGAVEYFRGGKLTETIRVTSADLDKAGAPTRFTPVNLGLEPGINITPANFEADNPIWNGDEICSPYEWSDDLKAGRRKRGPIFEAITRNNGRYDSPYLTDLERGAIDIAWKKLQASAKATRHELLWEDYVKSFIRRYSLDAEQAQTAWLVHSDCRDRARAYFDKKRSVFAELDEQSEKATDPETTRKWAERFSELYEPIEKIFRDDLKPRLERLPTRAQRRAVDSSKPADAP